MNPPVLSIAVPTLNRASLLGETLDLLLAQIEEAVVPIEILVSDNASEDETPKMFAASEARFPGVKYFRFDERVNIDGSFSRTVSCCKGEYILLFGDDDIPLPGFIREVTLAIREGSQLDLIYVNRLIGDATLNFTREIAHIERPYGRHTMEIGDFIERFTHQPGFVTSLIFSRRAWEGGADKVRPEYDGYSFLARVYWGAREGRAIYIGAPLLIQRRGVQAWKKEWPRYWLVAMPSILHDLDENGITGKSLAAWRENEISDFRFLIDCVVAKAYGYAVGEPFWAVSRNFQISSKRLLISHFVERCMPAFLAKWAYSRSPKMTKS